MKILYAGRLTAGSASLFRSNALERLGNDVVAVDLQQYWFSNPLLHKLSFRLSAGPNRTRLNTDVLRLVERERPLVFWADKVLLLEPKTLERMREKGVVTVSYMIDNPFGPRHDPGFRLYAKALPYFDLHVQQRDVSLAEYRRRGAREVMKVLIGFDPATHYPPPSAFNDAGRDRDVSFIGAPYDERAVALARVAQAGLPVVISGIERQWRRALSAHSFAGMFREGELTGDAYREAIWRSKINISFVTRSNQDEVAQKSFEIAGCGGFLLAERTDGHLEKFREDEEAVFFSGTEELIEKARSYLADVAARTRIAAAGRARALRDGYDSDSQLRLVMDRVAHRVKQIAGAR